MTFKTFAAGALATVFALGAPHAARAESRQSVKVDLRDETSLGGTRVPAGKYRITWTTSGAEADVKLVQGDKVVATSKGKIVERDKAAEDDLVVSRRNGSGFAMSEVRLRGEKTVLVLQAS
jgi:hypothetical protein